MAARGLGSCGGFIDVRGETSNRSRSRLLFAPQFCGGVAQLVERSVRNAEVRGSTPLASTI